MLESKFSCILFKKYFSSIYFVFSLLIFSSCASVHRGSPVVPPNNSILLPLKISTIAIDNDIDEPFQLLELTFENTATSWLKIHNASIEIDNKHVPNVSVVLKQDLRDWAQSTQVRKKSTKFTERMSQLGLATGGAVVGLLGSQSGSPAVRDLGFLTALAGVVWAAEDVLRETFYNGSRSYALPETHLYQPFAVPGKMFMRRWVLLNKPVGQIITHATLQLETVEGVKESYELTF